MEEWTQDNTGFGFMNTLYNTICTSFLDVGFTSNMIDIVKLSLNRLFRNLQDRSEILMQYFGPQNPNAGRNLRISIEKPNYLGSLKEKYYDTKPNPDSPVLTKETFKQIVEDKTIPLSVNESISKLYLDMLYSYESEYAMNLGITKEKFKKYLKLYYDLHAIEAISHLIISLSELLTSINQSINNECIKYSISYGKFVSNYYKENIKLYLDIRNNCLTRISNDLKTIQWISDLRLIIMVL